MISIKRLSCVLAGLFLIGFLVSCQEKKEFKMTDGMYAKITTTRGTIIVTLEYKKTPLTVLNFVGLAEGKLDVTQGKPFYDGLTFHRVIADFMIQGGDPEGSGRGGPGYQFDDEFDKSLTFSGPGILAMANAGPSTNGSQFFITHVATPWLNGKHTIFGHVVQGQDVVNAIQQGDTITHIEIVRVGADAQAFVADQAAWNKLANAGRDKDLALIASKYPDFKKDENGIFQKVVKVGQGASPAVGAIGVIKYKGSLLDGTVFDSSDLHGGTAEFPVGTGQTIKGFDLVLSSMKVGEKRIVILPPELAYGSQGVEQAGIKPNSFLVFELELVAIKK